MPARRWNHPLWYLSAGVPSRLSWTRAGASSWRQMELSALCEYCLWTCAEVLWCNALVRALLVGFAIRRLWVQVWLLHFHLVTLGKLLTPVCLCHQAVLLVDAVCLVRYPRAWRKAWQPTVRYMTNISIVPYAHIKRLTSLLSLPFYCIIIHIWLAVVELLTGPMSFLLIAQCTISCSVAVIVMNENLVTTLFSKVTDTCTTVHAAESTRRWGRENEIRGGFHCTWSKMKAAACQS